jgi:hypothetical protein
VTAFLLNPGGWATTIIIRMFGKAVKIRHCPATVSAPWKQEISRKTTGATGFREGGWTRLLNDDAVVSNLERA